MGCLFRLLLLLIVAGPLALAAFALDDAPLIRRPGTVAINDFKMAKALAERYDPRSMDPATLTRVAASEAEINTMLKGALAGVDWAAARVRIVPGGVLAGVSIALPWPANPFGRYLNIRGAIAPSRHGIALTRLAVGQIELPPVLAMSALSLFLDRLVGPGKGAPILASVRAVAIDDGKATLSFRPPPRLVEDVKASTLRRIAVGDPRTVRTYYDALAAALKRTRRRGAVSLAAFVRPLFRLAARRSAAGDPVRENEAAILALALTFGDPRFDTVIGDVLTPAERAGWRDRTRVRLDGRHDFVQHFLVSAGLALAGGRSVAGLAGEYKEVSDSDGGSGFSFTDIGADRTGVRFARQAIAGRAAAVKFQHILSSMAGERAFFPHLADLPQGMTEAAFRQRYGDIGAPAYRRMIAGIDRRIDATPLYR